MNKESLSKKLQSLDELESDFGEQLNLHGFYAEEALSEDELKAATPLLNGLKIDRKRYGELVESTAGGEKKIDKVFDFCADRYVAMASPLGTNEPIKSEDFLREARITARLQHPNIMSIHDIGLDESEKPYFTMDYISGQSLGDILRQLSEEDEVTIKKYPLNSLLDIFQKVCDAIAYAHSKGVIHLDLKPDNINVGAFGEVTVYDWGLAKVLGVGNCELKDESEWEFDADILNDVTLSGMVKGTPGYLAPEQIGTETEKSRASDIYALGAILYTILTLQAPIRAGSMDDLIQKTKRGEILQPDEVKQGGFVASSLSAVAMKALSLAPLDRYSSVEDLQREITQYQHGFATDAEHAGFWMNFKLLVKRHQRIFSLGVIFILIFSSFALYSFLKINHERNQALEAQHKAEENFQLYKFENEQKIKIDKDLRSLVHQSSLGGHYETTRIMIESLDKAIADESSQLDKDQLRSFKGDLHFSLQEFNQAKELYENVNSVLYEIAQEFALIKASDSDLLTGVQLGELMERFTSYNYKYVAYQTFYYHMLRNPEKNPRHYTKAVKNILDLLNNKAHWLYGELELEDKNGLNHLSLREAPYQLFILPIASAEPYNVLECLNLNSIDFSDSALNDLERLMGLRLERVNIKGTRVSHEKTRLMIDVLGLKTLIIDQGQFEESKLKNLSKLIELSYEDK